MKTEVKQPEARNSITEGKFSTRIFSFKSSSIHLLKEFSISQSVLVICRVLSIRAQLGIYVFKCVDDTGSFDAKFISGQFFKEPEWMNTLNEWENEYFKFFITLKKNMENDERIYYVEKVEKLKDFDELIYERLQMMLRKLREN